MNASDVIIWLLLSLVLAYGIVGIASVIFGIAEDCVDEKIEELKKEIREEIDKWQQ